MCNAGDMPFVNKKVQRVGLNAEVFLLNKYSFLTSSGIFNASTLLFGNYRSVTDPY